MIWSEFCGRGRVYFYYFVNGHNTLFLSSQDRTVGEAQMKIANKGK